MQEHSDVTEPLRGLTTDPDLEAGEHKQDPSALFRLDSSAAVDSSLGCRSIGCRTRVCPQIKLGKTCLCEFATGSTRADQLLEGLSTPRTHSCECSAGSSASTRIEITEGFCCPSEIDSIVALLDPVSGVTSVSVNATTKIALIKHNPEMVRPEALLEVLNGSARFEGRLNKQKMLKTKIRIEGMCCSSEVPQVEAILKPIPGVVAVFVNAVSKEATVQHDPSLTTPALLVQALCQGPFDGSSLKSTEDAPRDDKRCPKWNVMLSGAFLLAAFAHYGEPEEDWLKYFQYSAVPAILLAIPPILKKAVANMLALNIDINVLMTLAVAGACAMRDFQEAAEVVFLFALSEWLEDRAMGSARAMIESVLSLKPEQATLAVTGEVVPVEEVQVGTRLRVLPGDKIALDGLVVQGSSTVDESALTGEARPIKKELGDMLKSGTTNRDQYLEMETTAVAEDSTAAKLVELVDEAQRQKSPTQQTVDKFAKIYTPVMVVIAVGLASVPWAFMSTDDAKGMFKRALEFLVVACPCALVISTPIVYVCCLASSAKHGILVKGGAFLETLARLGVMAVDKTGTLTEGSFRVTHMETVGEPQGGLARMMCCMASVEAQSQHPMAAPLVQYAQDQGVELSREVSEFETLKGEGVAALLEGTHKVHVGNSRMARRLGWFKQHPAAARSATNWENQAGTVGWVGVDGTLMGLVCVNDVIRAEAPAAMQALAKLGVHTVMLTGDNKGAAEAIRQQANLSEAKAELLPQDKTANIQQFKKEIENETRCKVAMVGDGINDTPALAMSDIGIAMGAEGTAAAMETADAVLMTSDLMNLAKMVELGQRCQGKITQNIVLAVASKVIMLVLIGLNYATLWMAVLADVGTMLVVVFNGMLLLNF